MASLDDLEKAMTESLERRGVLHKIQASLRAQVYTAVCAPASLRPKESNENSLVNWLVHEYLQYTGLHLSSSVLTSESGSQPRHLSRDQVEQALGVSTRGTNAEKLPLLYSLVFQHASSSAALAAMGDGSILDTVGSSVDDTQDDPGTVSNDMTGQRHSVHVPAMN